MGNGLTSRDFADTLIGQLRKAVAPVTIDAPESISIHFKDRSVIAFSTRRDDARPEAFTLFTAAGVFEE